MLCTHGLCVPFVQVADCLTDVTAVAGVMGEMEVGSAAICDHDCSCIKNTPLTSSRVCCCRVLSRDLSTDKAVGATEEMEAVGVMAEMAVDGLMAVMAVVIRRNVRRCRVQATVAIAVAVQRWFSSFSVSIAYPL